MAQAAPSWSSTRLGPGPGLPAPLSPTEHKVCTALRPPGPGPATPASLGPRATRHQAPTRGPPTKPPTEGRPPSPHPRAAHQAPDRGPLTKSPTEGRPPSPHLRAAHRPGRLPPSPQPRAAHQPGHPPPSPRLASQEPGAPVSRTRSRSLRAWALGSVARVLAVGFAKEVVPLSLLSSGLAWPGLSCWQALLVPVP